MATTRFAEILSTRRKQLGLSIPQAAKVLRMRESVLVAFEDGDFERLPALGYAQGMIASYARYLGLDSRQVTELYEREHEQFVQERTGRSTSGLARLSDEPGYRGYSTSVIPVTHDESPRTSSATPTPLLSGARTSSSSGRSYATSGYVPTRASDAASERYSASVARGGSERRYTARVPGDRDERARRQQAATARRTRGADAGRARSGDSSFGAYPDDIVTRRVSSGQYRDDMRYDDAARPYRPSSTRAGRVAARSAVAPARPNVRRRQAPSQDRDPRMRSRRRQPEPKGLAGALQRFSEDPSRVILAGGLVLATILALIIAFSVRSCARGSDDTRTVSVVTATTSATTAATTTSADEQAALSAAAAKQAALSAAAASQETVVKVSVSEGSTTWVEIVSDGEQKVASSVTGAWSEQYTVTKSITIQVADSSVVTVEKNGERVQLSKTSGSLASVTIEGTDPSAATTAAATTEVATGSASDGSTSTKSSD